MLNMIAALIIAVANASTTFIARRLAFMISLARLASPLAACAQRKN
jgi:hypothetical protein